MDVARQTALALLETVLSKRHAFDDSFARAVEPLTPQDRGFVRQLCATVLRRLGQIDDLIDGCLQKPLPPGMSAPRDILRLGVAQLLFLNTPAHAAIDTSVTLADSHADKRVAAFKGVVNAVLRRLSQEGAAKRARQDGPRLNTPKWLWDSWSKAYGGQKARQIAEMHLREPALDLTLKPGLDPKQWAQKLAGQALATGTVRITAAGRIEELAGYNDGAWWVQDAAAALPARLFGDIAGKSVIDLCAAPGGKTAQLASAGASVIAVDRAPPRVRTLNTNLRRLKLDVEVVTADGTTWAPPAPADAVLLDAPCSATGTIRRHPDVALLKSERDVTSVKTVQTELLKNAARMLKPGGTLVYCVCSLQPEEGPQQVNAFLKGHQGFSRKPVTADEIGGLAELITPDGDLRTLPLHLGEQGGMDGFYVARLVKKS
ncbi:RsmB/NOP family class I SAM-dependent RNA methyltransferase [Emcibacter sp. SYSU 3D8]|uniref:RsmB/NOP family class I SAM-dependent RNA methyltransferase n=1 Tax=Emcibacter sp. SYSU 3D8 TaxID=3133969 RepID=UPI0031FF2E0E